MVHLGELKLEEKTKGILLLGACSIASYKWPNLYMVPQMSITSRSTRVNARGTPYNHEV
jgi:hypothetical protein